MHLRTFYALCPCCSRMRRSAFVMGRSFVARALALVLYDFKKARAATVCTAPPAFRLSELSALEFACFRPGSALLSSFH